MIINLALPFIARDLNIDTQTTGLVVSTVAVGALLAFFVVRLADRVGRRPVFLWSVALYSLLSLLTAFTYNIPQFTLCQFAARVFLVAVWAIGFIIIAEEFTVEFRGRALGLFQSVAAVGAIFPAVLMPLASATTFGWRLLYIIGALPLIVLFFLNKDFYETERFKKTQAAGAERPGLWTVFRPPYRKYMVVVAGLWFCLYLGYAASMNFFSYRVVNELGWSETRVGLTNALSYAIGLAGYFIAGRLMDSIGRRRTALIFLLTGAAAIVGTFQAKPYELVLVMQIIACLTVGVFTVIGASFTNELFPTVVRANATAWGNNIIGRLGAIIAPAAIGFLSVTVGGVGNAVSLMAVGPVVAAILILFFLPETRRQEIVDLPQ